MWEQCAFRSPRLLCAEVCRSKTTFSVCLSSQDEVLHSQSWHTGLMCTAWEWKLLWKSFSDFNRTARPACKCNRRGNWVSLSRRHSNAERELENVILRISWDFGCQHVNHTKKHTGVWVRLCFSFLERRKQRDTLTLDPHGKSFFQGVKFSVQTISRGRVA